MDIYILVILVSKQFATFWHISLNNCICYICACLCYLQFIYHVSSEKMVSKMLLNWLCCFYSLFQILQCWFTCILHNLASAIYRFRLPCIRKICVEVALSPTCHKLLPILCFKFCNVFIVWSFICIFIVCQCYFCGVLYVLASFIRRFVFPVSLEKFVFWLFINDLFCSKFLCSRVWKWFLPSYSGLPL